MKSSAYNKIVPYNGEHLIFNQVTGALIKVGDSVFAKLLKILNGDFFDTKLSQELYRLGYLVDDKGDERIHLREVFEKKIKNHTNKHLFITVTDRCNLGCHYCFEEKNQWIKMSKETQESLIEFSKAFLTETETKYFGIGWYGGEPTMNMSAIENLSKFYTKFCETNNIQFYQMMITNGTTFTNAICDKLISLKIKRVQITVDGFKEDHDKSRPYLKDLKIEDMNDAQKRQISKINPKLLLPVFGQKQSPPKSSYDEIIKGIERYVNRGGEVSLRMNVSEKTIHRVTNLLDDLHKRNLFEKNEKGGYVYAYAHPIYDAGGCGSNDGGNCGSCVVSTMKMESFAKKIDHIKNWYKENNIKYFDHSVTMKFTGDTCTANKKYEYIVNPDGTLCKCTHDVGKPDKVIGDVRDMRPDPNAMEHMLTSYDKFNPFDDKECYSCEVLPICMGGCKANNKVGQNEKYDAGCITTRFTFDSDVIRLYERTISEQQQEENYDQALRFSH
jgi:uncharacterized protein